MTLTKNIVRGVQTVMNVLTWDTGRTGRPWRLVGQLDPAPVLLTRQRTLTPLPWRPCLRVADRRVSFKVWPLGRVDPPRWRDRAYVRTARLPRSVDVAGRSGWYVGHVPGGGSAVYRGLRVGR